MVENIEHVAGNYMAKVLGDSISPDGVRLTTLIARFPRFILAELNTHRVLSRNSASSRAIPTERLIEAVRKNAFVPETFNKRVKGMGIGEQIEGSAERDARHEWQRASFYAANSAENLAGIGIDKSRANRVLEPFMWHTAIISSTEWDNMFGLRCPDGDEPQADFPAQWEFQQLAILMRNAMWHADPQELKYGEWHLPLIHPFGSDVDSDIESKKKVCARQLARVSFDTHTQSESPDVAIIKSDELASSAHFSPFEHIARPLSYGDTFDPAFNEKIMMPVSLLSCTNLSQCLASMWCGNLRGWVQMRKEFKYEDNHLLALNAVGETDD